MRGDEGENKGHTQQKKPGSHHQSDIKSQTTSGAIHIQDYSFHINEPSENIPHRAIHVCLFGSLLLVSFSGVVDTGAFK
ncbi:hypothetical protein STEG23_037032 [Scotinomys teguina]